MKYVMGTFARKYDVFLEGDEFITNRKSDGSYKILSINDDRTVYVKVNHPTYCTHRTYGIYELLVKINMHSAGFRHITSDSRMLALRKLIKSKGRYRYAYHLNSK